MWHRGLRRRFSTWTRRRFATALALIPSAGLVAAGLAPSRSSAAATPFTAHEADTLKRLCWLLYPFPGLGDAPYARVVDALTTAASDDANAELVLLGIAALDARSRSTWLELDEADQVEALAAIQSGPFFQYVLGETRSQLFNDRELWAHIGYEGSSLEFGGYVGRGLNDIAWLDDD